MNRQTLNFLSDIIRPGFTTKTTSSKKFTEANRHQRRAMAVVNKRHLREAGSTPHFDKAKVKYFDKGEEKETSAREGNAPTISHINPNILYTDVADTHAGDIGNSQANIPNSNAVMRVWKHEGDSKLHGFMAVAIRSGKDGSIRTFYTSATTVTPFSTARHKNLGLTSAMPWYSYPNFRQNLSINTGGILKDHADLDKIDEKIHSLFGKGGKAAEGVDEAKSGSVALMDSFDKLLGIKSTGEAYGWKFDVEVSRPDLVIAGNIKAIKMSELEAKQAQNICGWFDYERDNQEASTRGDVLLRHRTKAIEDLVINGGVKCGYYFRRETDKRGQVHTKAIPGIKLFVHGGEDAPFIEPMERYVTRAANIQACFYDKDAFVNGDYEWDDRLRSDSAKKYFGELKSRLLKEYSRIDAQGGMMPLSAMAKADSPNPVYPDDVDKKLFLFPNIIHIIDQSIDDTVHQNYFGSRGFAGHKQLYGLADWEAKVHELAGGEEQNRGMVLDQMQNTEARETTEHKTAQSHRLEKYLPDIMKAYNINLNGKKWDSINFSARDWYYTEIKHKPVEGKGMWPKTMVLIPPIKDEGPAERERRFKGIVEHLKGRFGDEKKHNYYDDVPRLLPQEDSVRNLSGVMQIDNPKCRDILFVVGNGKEIDTVPIDTVGSLAHKFINKPEEGMRDNNHNSLEGYYGFDGKYVRKAEEETTQADAQEELKDAQSKAAERALGTLLMSHGKDYDAQKEYQNAMTKLRASFQVLYAPSSDFSLKEALASLGTFKFKDYAFPDEDITLRFDGDGQLYRIFPGNKNSKPSAMPLPADVFSDDSFYMKVVKTLSRAARGDVMTHSQVLPIDRTEVFNITNNDNPVARRHAENYLRWSTDLVNHVAEMRGKSEFDRIKTVAGIATLRDILGFAEMNEKTLAARRKFSMNPVDFDINQPDVQISDLAYQLEQVVIQSNMNFQELVQNHFKKKLLQDQKFIDAYKLPEADIKAMRQRIDDKVLSLQTSLDIQSQAWTDVRLGMRAMVSNDPESIAALRHMEQFDELPEEKGIVDKIIEDVTNMIDRVWNNFVSVVSTTIDTFTNFDRIYKNFTGSFSRAYEAAIKTFFTIFWSDFVDTHFDSHRMKWAKNMIHDVSGDVIGLKHMSAGAIERLERQIGGQRADKVSPEHELKNTMLQQGVKPHFNVNDLSSLPGRFKAARAEAFDNPQVTVPTSKAGSEFGNDEFDVTYFLRDETKAALLGYKRSYQTDVEGFRAWWTRGEGSQGSMGSVSGQNLLTPTSFYDGKSNVSNKWTQNQKFVSPDQVRISDDGKEVKIRYRLSDIGMTVEDVYKSPRERKEARLARKQNRYLRKYSGGDDYSYSNG